MQTAKKTYKNDQHFFEESLKNVPGNEQVDKGFDSNLGTFVRILRKVVGLFLGRGGVGGLVGRWGVGVGGR